MSASISVIMPVYNGAAMFERAIRSVLRQSFQDWEAIAVDDCSNDASADVLAAWANRDPRIRAIRREENGGVSAARNVAIQHACGWFVTYLDQDDEYHPDYLANVASLGDQADVLMFGYDFIYEDVPAENRLPSWDPGSVRQLLFGQNISTPLGVAHRRQWWEAVGGFNEAWCEEDSDFWRRMARAGAKYVFLPLKSGIYHVRRNSASRVPHITQRQRKMFLENWGAGRPLYWKGDGESEIASHKSQMREDTISQDVFHPVIVPLAQARARTRKVVCVSPHCIIDLNRDAARATLDGLQLLAATGFECEVFCGTHFEATEEIHTEEILARQGTRHEVRNAQIGPYRARMTFAVQGKVPLTLFETVSTRSTWRDNAEAAAFLTGCELFVTKQRPDAVWTYGDDPVSLAVQQLAKRLDIPIVFALHDLVHCSPAPFALVDYVVVPSESARQHYWRTLGLACQVLPPVLDHTIEEQRSPDHLAPIYREFFSRITHQPGPPLVPKEIVKG